MGGLFIQLINSLTHKAHPGEGAVLCLYVILIENLMTTLLNDGPRSSARGTYRCRGAGPERQSRLLLRADDVVFLDMANFPVKIHKMRLKNQLKI